MQIQNRGPMLNKNCSIDESKIIQWLQNQNDSRAWSAVRIIQEPVSAEKIKHRMSDVLDFLAEKAKMNVEAGQSYLLVLNALDSIKDGVRHAA